MTDIRELVIRGSDILEADKFSYDRSKYLNASEAGNCIRKAWYGKHMPEFAGEQDWGYARRGIHIEKFMVEALRASNVPLINAWPAQWSMQDEKRRLSATPEGYIAWDDYWEGFEIKSIDPRTNKASLPKEPHVIQLQIGMELIDQQIDRPDGVTFEGGLLIYVDASNYFDIEVFQIDRDPTILDRMAKRAKKVLNSTTPDAMDREGKANGGKECKTMCAFREICQPELKDGRQGKRANRGSKFDDQAKRFMDIKDEEDRLKMERDVLKEDIIGSLNDREMKKVMVGNIEVELASVKGRSSLDKKAVEKAGIDLSPFEKTGVPSERLTLKRT
jgi:CRISPR/Cas system-associated exonuclease Cas4 (RecB family)